MSLFSHGAASEVYEYALNTPVQLPENYAQLRKVQLGSKLSNTSSAQ